MKKMLIACSVLAAFSLTSCATIFTGTKDTISFNSNVKGTAVSIKGIERCTTPCSVPIKRSLSSTLVQFTKDGYAPKTIELDKKFNYVSLVNILLVQGFIIGGGIDAATGALMKYDTKVYNIKMKKQ